MWPADWLLTKCLPERRACGQRTNIFSRLLDWSVIRWVFGFLGVAFGPPMVEEADCSVTPQAKLVLTVY